MSFLMSDKEVAYQRKIFQENLRLYGVDAVLYPIKEPEESYNMYQDIDKVKGYDDTGYPLTVTFEETPAIKTLRQFGWYDLDADALPSIGYLPISVIDPQGNEVRPKLDDCLEVISRSYGSKKFLIKDVKSAGFPEVIYWICKLVPNRTDVE